MCGRHQKPQSWPGDKNWSSDSSWLVDGGWPTMVDEKRKGASRSAL